MLPLFQVLSAFWALAVVPVALVILPVAITWHGRIFGLAWICLGVAPLLTALGKAMERPVWKRRAAGLFATGIGLYALLVLYSPQPRQNARVAALSPAKPDILRRIQPAHLLPEADQIALGSVVMLPLDSLLTVRQSLQLRWLTRKMYLEMDTDADFRQLSSALPEMYRSFWSVANVADDGFLYIPANLDRRAASPVLVFLHGSGGNFKAYLWILSKVADRTGCILVAPSNGFGNWRSPETERLVDFALHRAAAAASIDAKRVHIMGLSNGGLGVCQALDANPSGWASAVLISPVFDQAALEHLVRGRALAGKSIFVISGVEDDRIPISYVRNSSAELARAGAGVTIVEVPGANHFLIFSHRARLVDELVHWSAGH